MTPASSAGKDFQMRNDAKLYHHGHPARRCPGAGTYGVRMKGFLAKMAAKHNLLDGYARIDGDAS
jgi:hypothetical protein